MKKGKIFSCSPFSSVVAGKWWKSVPSLLLSGGLSPPSTPSNPTMEVAITITTLARARAVGPTSPAITRAGAGLVAGRLDWDLGAAGGSKAPNLMRHWCWCTSLYPHSSSCTLLLPILTTPSIGLAHFFAPLCNQ